jgi:uncharacterized membrane protein
MKKLIYQFLTISVILYIIVMIVVFGYSTYLSYLPQQTFDPSLGKALEPFSKRLIASSYVALLAFIILSPIILVYMRWRNSKKKEDQ